MSELAAREEIGSLIHLIRGHKVMLDFELARLYGVPTKSLNLAVKRNLIRFPDDFMFRLTEPEVESLRFQIETSSWGGHRYRPYAFTEQGVAMLSSVLRSRRAVLVNIAIMRAFVRLREVLVRNKEFAKSLAAIEKQLSEQQSALGNHAKHIRTIFEALRRLMEPPKNRRRRIGFVP